MAAIRTASLIFLLFAMTAVQASGTRPPEHSRLTYSFTCPSGASGHLSYVKDFDDKIKSELSLWVNGRYVQDDPSVTSQLKGKTIEQLQASCAGDITSIIMRTFDPAADLSTQPAWFTISIDLNGKVIADGA